MYIQKFDAVLILIGLSFNVSCQDTEAKQTSLNFVWEDDFSPEEKKKVTIRLN